MPFKGEVRTVAQRGRKTKAYGSKGAGGQSGQEKSNTGEPKPDKKAPRCPAWLEDEAKKEWKRMAKQMEHLGILTEIDMAAFCRILPSVCKVERGGGIYYTARYNREDSKRILAAGAAGFHCPDLP